MAELVKDFWHFISFLGIEDEMEISYEQRKIRVFFNRCLFVGFFTLIGTLIGSFAFIEYYALLNLVSCLAIIIALLLHVRGYFNIAKRVVVYSIFIVGLILTAYSGGDFLYHLGIITVLTFAWVMFSPKTELFELVLFSGFTVFGYLIGELNLFHAPDFSTHPDLLITRILNLVGYTFVTLIFISFILRLNRQYEENLKRIVAQKELLIQEVLNKTKALEAESTVLEDKIVARTSELLEQKKILELKNAEKVVLLKEIHHRVKNNLQIIVSLLNLQSGKFDDPKVLDAINETQNRIISMSLVHQRMYQTADFVAVDFKEYSELLFQNIRMLYAEKEIRYSCNINSDLKLDVETAIPLGLAINEMITNSFKHAFPNVQKNNEIIIDLMAKDNGLYFLRYKDNGIGLPEKQEIENSKSLGFQLMNALVEQINGELKHYNEGGAVFEISFPGNV